MVGRQVRGNMLPAAVVIDGPSRVQCSEEYRLAHRSSESQEKISVTHLVR